jgi:hypothetical protein
LGWFLNVFDLHYDSPGLNVVLNESLNTINKGNGNKVSSVGIIVFHVEAHKIINNLQYVLGWFLNVFELQYDS